MTRIGAIVLNVSDTRRAATFWSQALGYLPDANPDFLVPTGTEAPRLHLDNDDRTHLDLWAANEEEQLAEVERLLELGATRVDWDYPADADFVVLADPDGNRFCVVNTSALTTATREVLERTQARHARPLRLTERPDARTGREVRRGRAVPRMPRQRAAARKLSQ